LKAEADSLPEFDLSPPVDHPWTRRFTAIAVDEAYTTVSLAEQAIVGFVKGMEGLA
jgi:hypothetical protein